MSNFDLVLLCICYQTVPLVRIGTRRNQTKTMNTREINHEEELMLRRIAFALEAEGMRFPTSCQSVEAYLAAHPEANEPMPDHLPSPMDLVRAAQKRREEQKK